MGLVVDPLRTKHTSDFHGKAYFCCSAKCLDKFKADPEGYIRPAEADQALAKLASDATTAGLVRPSLESPIRDLDHARCWPWESLVL